MKHFMHECFSALEWDKDRVDGVLESILRESEMMMRNSLIVSLWFLVFLFMFDVVVVVEVSKASFFDIFVSVGMRQSDLINIFNYLTCM